MIRKIIHGHAYRPEGRLTEFESIRVDPLSDGPTKGISPMRKIMVGFAVWLVAGLTAFGLCDGHAEAHEGGLIPPVSACNPDAFGGFNWRWVGCNHENHLHAQWRDGRGTPGHTVRAYRREARAFRAWLEHLDG